MKKIRIVLSVLACVFAFTAALAVHAVSLEQKWYSRHPTTGAPISQLPSEPTCVGGPNFCAGLYNIVNGQPSGQPVQSKIGVME